MLWLQTTIVVLWAQISCHGATRSMSKGSKMATVLKNLHEDINRLRANKVMRCKKPQFNTILRLKCDGKLDEAFLCAAEELLAKEGARGQLWTLLGQIYHARGKVNRGNKCFKEAAKISGKFVGQIMKWHFLGPFQIGKSEVDGDPVEVLGGIGLASCQKNEKTFVAYSELIPGGEVRWNVVEPDENGIVVVEPNVNWEALVGSLQSVAVTEWQGWLVGDFTINQEMTILIQCLGVSTIYINDHILTGDLYRRDQYWYPVHLKPGIHSVILRARSDSKMMFACNLKPHDQPSGFQIHEPLTPDLLEGQIFSNLLSVPVTNLSPGRWLTITKLTVASQISGPDISLHLARNQSFSIAPGQVRPLKAYVKFKGSKGRKSEDKCVNVTGTFQLRSNDGQTEDKMFVMRCRKKTESFFFTFVDHDGSVQRAVAIFPIIHPKTTSSHAYPILLTLHGSGIPAQNHADSYKRKENGHWILGVEGLWILAPTRYGDHSWEGPGELTSMMALRKLAERTLEHDWIGCKADENAVVFSGHSSGGHAAWYKT